eukprot:4022931-Amphidinium_carterae.1
MRNQRIRIVGSVRGLGEWSAEEGVDLFRQDDQWVSLLIEVPAETWLRYSIVDVTGKEWTWDPDYDWSTDRCIKSPPCGQVLEVFDSGSWASWEEPGLATTDRYRLLRRLAMHVPAAGSQRVYPFESKRGVVMNYALYVPPGHGGAHDSFKWPLLLGS